MSKRRRPFKKRYYRRSLSDRNYDDPLYKKWRVDVFKRDKFKCQWPRCTCKTKLRAHHIRTWAAHPGLRFILMNGITLCDEHHKKVTGHEDVYYKTLMEINMRKKK